MDGAPALEEARVLYLEARAAEGARAARGQLDHGDEGPALLAALVAVNTLGGNRELVIDARLPGVLAAAVAIKLKAPVLIVVVIAALVTASVRAATG